MKSAVIYLRVSTDRQAEKDLSLPAQLKACQRLAKEMDFSVVKIFQDAGESARTSNRPEFLDMIDFCLAHVKTLNLGAVICWDTSRFARNRYDAILYKKQLAGKGVKVLFASQPIGEGAEGQLLEGFLELVDEFYSKQLSRNIIRGMRENAHRGFLNGAHAPFGYRLIKTPDERGNLKSRLEIEGCEAEVVRRLFQLYLQGYGFKALAEKMRDQEVAYRNGRPFAKKTIEYILGNPVYTGTLRFQDIVVEDIHPAIVSKDVFEEIQRLRQERTPSRAPGRRMSSPLLFSGLLFCEACGQSLTFERTFKPHKTYTYYSCSSFKSKQTSCPQRVRFDSYKLDRFLLGKIAERILTDDNARRVIQELEGFRAEILNQSRSRKLKLQRELSGVLKKIDNLIEAVANGTLPREIVKDRVERLREEKARLEVELVHGRVIAFPRVSASRRFVENFRKICKEVIQSGDIRKRRTFLQSFIKKIDLTKTTCKVTYDLARLLAAKEDVSSLRDGMVVPAGLEPAFSA